MAYPVDNTTPPPPPPPPPEPTAANLEEATPEQAQAAVDTMTPEQQAALTTEVAALPATERTDLINGLATKLDAQQLQKLEPVFGAPVVLEAVQTRSPATVRESYESLVGTNPAAGTAQPSGRSEQEQIAQAQTDYADHVENQGILAQSALAELMTANAGDPAYLAELVKLAHDGGVLDMVVNPMYGGLYEKDAAGQYVVNNTLASFDADARRDVFAQAITAALDRGTLSEADVREYALHSPGWGDVAARAGVGQVGATDATTTTSTELDGRIDDYNDAKEDVEALDQEMGELMAQAGPMTPEQQAAFVKAFREDPEHAGTYAKLTQASNDLSSYVTQNREAVLDAAVRDPAVAQLVHDALVGMAEDGHGVEAIELLTEINAGGPDSALAAAFAGFDDLSGPVLENAASSAMAQLLEQNNGDVSASAEQFKTLFGALVQAWPAKAGVDDFKLGSQLLDQAAKGDVKALQAYLAEYDAKSPMLRALAGAGIVLGAVGAINAGTNGDYVNMIAGFAQSGENAARLVAGTMGGITAVGEAAQQAGRFATFAGKLAPGLGLIANSASLVNSIREASDGNVGYAIAAFGDVLGILGSALEFTPAAPAGFIVSGIGAIISGLGSFVGEIINGNERRETIERYLTEAGVDPSIVDEMANSGKQLFEMAERLQMSPEQVQALLKAHPDIGGAPGLAGTFTEVAAAAGISGDNVDDFAAALAKGDGDFAWDLMGVSQHAPANPDERAAFFRHYLESTYPDAAQFAAGVSPDLFGDAAQQREAAIRDYNQSMGSMYIDMTIANFLKDNDDPAYRAEMMKQIADSGRLEMWAETIGGYGDQWSEAVKQSVADALAAGTLTQEQADLVLSKF